MALKRVPSPNGKTLHWNCENRNCSYDSNEMTKTKANFDTSAPLAFALGSLIVRSRRIAARVPAENLLQ